MTDITTRYFHGGFGDLKVGPFVLPPVQTKAPSLARFGGAGVCDPSKVYVCTLFDGALLFAGMHHSGRGKVYEVEPVGPVEKDPDARVDGLSFSCERAKVVKVFRVKGKTIKRIQKAMLEDAA